MRTMKLLPVVILCLIQLSQGFVLEDVFGWLTKSRTRKSVPALERTECEVSQFKSVSKFESHKFTGDWYEAYRTATSLPIFSSGVWKFQTTKVHGVLSFLFSARLINQSCMRPVTGNVTTSGPGSIVMTYDGLKGTVREEYKVLETDYNHKAVLYGCRHVLRSGHCEPSASFLVVLTRYRSLAAAVGESLKSVAKEVCIEPASLLQQIISKSCNLDHLELPQVKLPDWPTCKGTAICTLACPPCCTESEDGCIHCNCGPEENQAGFAGLKETFEEEDTAPQAPPDTDEDKECVDSVSSCADSDCMLLEIRPGCQVCKCGLIHSPPGPPVDAAPAMAPEIKVHDIKDVRECPTTCRIVTELNQMKCNCSNKDICEPIPPRVPYSCDGPDERYYFDHRTSTCHAFFGSCLPDRNNFKTLQDCIKTCADVCELSPVSETCPGDFKEPELRYYHNRVTGECSEFAYSGCGGNENNYENIETCQHRCPGKFQGTHEHQTINEICNQSSDNGTCPEAGKKELMYFYLPVTKTCTTFFYSGCGGNDNKFKDEADCKDKCIEGHFNPDQCLTVSNCPCETEDKDGCPYCPCNGVSTALGSSLFILLTSSVAWLAMQRRT